MIEAKNNSNDNIYIQSATLNEKTLNQAVISHADLIKGGKLILNMGSKPNESWGKD